MKLSDREVQELFRHTAEVKAHAEAICDLARAAREEREQERERRASNRRLLEKALGSRSATRAI
jgi:RNA polymerase-interacting CarD/CdnL/TRCF family regulator